MFNCQVNNLGVTLMHAPEVDPVGTWDLVDSLVENSVTGEVTRPRGIHPGGRLIYTAGGGMCAVVTAEGRKPLEGNDDIVKASADLFHSVNAYAGTYTVAGSTVTHQVEVASNPAWSGTAQVRYVSREGDRLTLDANITLAGAALTKVRLVWRRIG